MSNNKPKKFPIFRSKYTPAVIRNLKHAKAWFKWYKAGKSIEWIAKNYGVPEIVVKAVLILKYPFLRGKLENKKENIK